MNQLCDSSTLKNIRKTAINFDSKFLSNTVGDKNQEQTPKKSKIVLYSITQMSYEYSGHVIILKTERSKKLMTQYRAGHEIQKYIL